MIVTATGLSIKVLGGVALSVDGKRVDVADRLIYRGAMIEGVPNMAFSFGYATATWTLKSDLTARFVVRLLRHMARTGRRTVMPRRAPTGTARGPMVTLDAGYIRRAAGLLPKTGPAPWRSASNYLLDTRAMLLSRLDDGVLQFGPRGRAAVKSA
jgi:cation diffusion facilitator CzcD-associated flavoprotein CzcO